MLAVVCLGKVMRLLVVNLVGLVGFVLRVGARRFMIVVGFQLEIFK